MAVGSGCEITVMLKYYMNFTLDISKFMCIFKNIMIATIISPWSKYIATSVHHSFSITKRTSAGFSSFFDHTR